MPARADKITIALKNVRPSLVAWQVDPGEHEEPLEVTVSRRSREMAGLEPRTMWNVDLVRKSAARVFDVKVTPHDDRQVLEAEGSAESLTLLQNAMVLMDRQLQATEISAVLAEVPRESLTALGLTSSPHRVNSANMSSDVLKTLEALVAQKRARIISSPRITAIDGYTAAIHTLYGKANDVRGDR